MAATFDLPAHEFRLIEAADYGLNGRRLNTLLEQGEIERIGRGLYRPTALPTTDLDRLEIAAKAPFATICLASALAEHELIDEIPARIDIALPRNTRAPEIGGPIAWHRFDRATFELGRTEIAISGSRRRIGIYSAERSIVDAFRMRRTIGYEIPTEALKNWLRRRGSRPTTLIKFASQIPKSSGPLMQALEYLS